MRALIGHLVSLSPPQGNLRVRFLTLTIPSTDDPDQGVADLIAGFRRLRQRKFWHESSIGGLYVIELTRSVHGWHPHLHVLIYGLYLPWKQLLTAWRGVSAGRGVWIKQTYGAPIAVASYVTKYVTKTKLSEGDRREASRALKNARLVQVFGDWQSYGKPTRPAPVCPKCGDNNWVSLPTKYWKTNPANLYRRSHGS